MIQNLPKHLPFDISEFLMNVIDWAEHNPSLLAVALVGSYARGDASPASDVDLMLLSTHPDSFIQDRKWISMFGDAARIEEEEWGKVKSLRATYLGGLEVEFGIAGMEWASDPSDLGDARVIQDGIILLYDNDELLSKRITSFSVD